MGRPPGSRNKNIDTIKTNEILSAVSGITLENVSNKLAAVQVEVQHTLAGLSTKLTEQLAVLGNVENAIALKKDELKQLRDIEVTASTLDELTAQIEAQREDWLKEQQKKLEHFAALEAQRQVGWAREEEQYNYKKLQERQKSEDAFAARMIESEKANRNKQEQLEKLWAEREASLKTREQELVELRNQVANFPATLKAEVDKNVAVATNALKRTYEMETKISSAENASTIKLAEQQNKSLEKTIGELNAQVLGLKDQLKSAHDDIKTISQKALESASGREALANLQRTVENLQSNKSSK